MEFRLGMLDDPRVIALLDHHVRTAHASTAPGSAHALDHAGLAAADIRFWTVWRGDTLLGVGAWKRLGQGHGEVKSMHTVEVARGKGVLRRGRAPSSSPACSDGSSMKDSR